MSFLRGEHAQLGVKFQLIKMLAHQLKAKAVQSSDMRRLEQSELLLPSILFGLELCLLLEPRPDSLPDFSGSRICEGDDENLIDGDGMIRINETIETPGDEGRRF